MNEPQPPQQPPAPIQPPQAPPAPIVPVPPPQQLPPAPQDADVNQMIANIEADNVRQQQQLKASIMAEAEQKFTEKMSAQQEASNASMAEMKAQLNALTAASEEQKRTVIEDYKSKLTAQADQLRNIEGELSQRQTNIPQQPNPYRQPPKQDNPGDGISDPAAQKAKLDEMYNAINGRNF